MAKPCSKSIGSIVPEAALQPPAGAGYGGIDRKACVCERATLYLEEYKPANLYKGNDQEIWQKLGAIIAREGDEVQ